MACKQRDRRCQICHRLIALKRCRTYPTAVLCGGRDCYAEHYRRRHNQASMLYQRRQRLAKKNLAQRAPQTNGLATVDTSLPRTWPDAVEALCGPVTSGEGLNDE